MSASAHDIYDPPPAPVAWNPPPALPLVWTRADVACLAAFALVLAFGSGLAWSFEPALAIVIILGGTLVVLESWVTALGFLSRLPAAESASRRWVIVLAAMMPWLLGLGIAAALMLGLFLVSDWVG